MSNQIDSKSYNLPNDDSDDNNDDNFNIILYKITKLGETIKTKQWFSNNYFFARCIANNDIKKYDKNFYILIKKTQIGISNNISGLDLCIQTKSEFINNDIDFHIGKMIISHV